MKGAPAKITAGKSFQRKTQTVKHYEDEQTQKRHSRKNSKKNDLAIGRGNYEGGAALSKKSELGNDSGGGGPRRDLGKKKLALPGGGRVERPGKGLAWIKRGKKARLSKGEVLKPGRNGGFPLGKGIEKKSWEGGGEGRGT